MKVQVTEIKGFPAEYLHTSMYGSYVIDCEIVGWDDKSERFMIKYFDPFSNEVDQSYAPYSRVTGWSWPTLREYFFNE